MKSFEDFRVQWLTQDKEMSIKSKAAEAANDIGVDDAEQFFAAFASSYSLQLLSEYHQWLSQN